jgi:ubiquinone/menaquinone biosynthesis C-methylase UbiE
MPLLPGDDLIAYYSARAREYENIYHRDDPVRQAELAKLGTELDYAVTSKSVIELACGTGYWTERIDRVTTSVLAVDASTEMLEMAGTKKLSQNVEFLQKDVLKIGYLNRHFDAAVANFWISHVPLDLLPDHIQDIANLLRAEGVLFIADNVYQPGVGGEFTGSEGELDTYKVRTNSDGSTWKVLKNYHTRSQLEALLTPLFHIDLIHFGTCYWWLKAVKH